MWNQKPSFRFEINNFSQKEDGFTSHRFLSNGNLWYAMVNQADGHLSLYLAVGCLFLLPSGWKKSAKFHFVLLNKSGKELYKSPNGVANTLFCAENPSSGFLKALPLTKLQEKGFLEKDILVVEVYIDSLVEIVSEEKAEADASRVLLLEEIIKKLEVDSSDTKEVISDDAFNLEKLDRRLKSLELMELGSKFSSLKEKLDKVCIDREMSDSVCEARGEEVEKRIKNLELMEIGVKMESLETKLDEVSLGRKKSDVADESRFQQLEEHVKELELMELGVKLDSLSIELEGSLELVESQAQELEDMRFEMCCLNKRLEVSLERKKSDESRIYQLEESVKDLVMMVSELKAKLEKKKDKSSADGFFLVD